MAEVAVLDVGMLDLAMGFHVVAPRELLAADRALVTLGPMDVGVMPAVRDDFIATDTAIEGRQSARDLDK